MTALPQIQSNQGKSPHSSLKLSKHNFPFFYHSFIIGREGKWKDTNCCARRSVAVRKSAECADLSRTGRSEKGSLRQLQRWGLMVSRSHQAGWAFQAEAVHQQYLGTKGTCLQVRGSWLGNSYPLSSLRTDAWGIRTLGMSVKAFLERISGGGVCVCMWVCMLP